MNKVIMQIKQLGKSFGSVQALKGININIREGEVHALCGENGAGKSTLVKILNGYYPYGSYEGEFSIQGKSCKFQLPKDATDAGIAMIYQEISILNNMTVADNIFAGKFPNKKGFVNTKEQNQKAQELLDMVELDISPQTIAGTLNASQQQQLMITHALIHNPKVLILDEPTSALTLAETQKLFSVIRNLKSRGVTCIYISHKLDELRQIADRITIIRDGENIETIDMSEFDINRIITGMVGRKIDNIYPKRDQETGGVVLEVKGLDVPNPKIKNKFYAKDISFQLHKSEILGFAGLVGAGRSEILNAIYGYLKKSAGEIEISGKKTDLKNPLRALKNGVVLLTEERKAQGLFEGCSVQENISSASLDKIRKGPFIRRKAERKFSNQYIKELNIKTPSGATNVANLSGGNQQKAVIAKAMMTNPSIVLLDEPTRGIDVGSKYEIYNLMNDMVARGISIVMVSSELPELLHMCDRILVVSGGKIVAEYTGEEANEDKIMLSATTAVK